MNYDIAFDRLIGHEGGYVNDPNDPGGETNWGLSKRTYPNLNIKDLTRSDARRIYRSDFWDVIKGDELVDGVAFQAFDFAVNSGIPTAIRALQRAVKVADDGHWGPVSQRALALQQESDTIQLLLAERLEYMTKLTKWDDFGRGWARRIAQNLRYGAEDS